MFESFSYQKPRTIAVKVITDSMHLPQDYHKLYAFQNGFVIQFMNLAHFAPAYISAR